jgi:hypothetical protein
MKKATMCFAAAFVACLAITNLSIAQSAVEEQQPQQPASVQGESVQQLQTATPGKHVKGTEMQSTGKKVSSSDTKVSSMQPVNPAASKMAAQGVAGAQPLKPLPPPVKDAPAKDSPKK